MATKMAISLTTLAAATAVYTSRGILDLRTKHGRLGETNSSPASYANQNRFGGDDDTLQCAEQAQKALKSSMCGKPMVGSTGAERLVEKAPKEPSLMLTLSG